VRAQEFERRERRRVQPLEEAALAIAQNDVADAEEAAEHHVHSQNAREQPVDVANGGTRDRLPEGTGSDGQQQLLDDVAPGESVFTQ